MRFPAVFYKSGSQPREFRSRLTGLAEERLVAIRFLFIELEPEKKLVLALLYSKSLHHARKKPITAI